MRYIGLCVFSLPISHVIIVRIRVLYLIIIIKSEVWPIFHCLGLSHETTVCAVCHCIFLWQQNGHNFVDNNFKFFSRNETCYILIKISLEFVANGPDVQKPALVWRIKSHKSDIIFMGQVSHENRVRFLLRCVVVTAEMASGTYSISWDRAYSGRHTNK